jgi:hypothetical protein
MLALPSENSSLNLSVPVYSFPLCLQVERMEVLALPSILPFKSLLSCLFLPLMFAGGTHGSDAGSTLRGLAFKSLISCLFLSLMFAGGTHGSDAGSTLRGLAFKSLSSCLFLPFMFTGGTHGSNAGSTL